MLKRLQISILVSSLILCSCSSKWHLNRAIKKDPSILTTQTETIYDTIRYDAIQDTIRIETTNEIIDTIFKEIGTRLVDSVEYVPKEDVLRLKSKLKAKIRLIKLPYLYEDSIIKINIDTLNGFFNISYTLPEKEIITAKVVNNTTIEQKFNWKPYIYWGLPILLLLLIGRVFLKFYGF